MRAYSGPPLYVWDYVSSPTGELEWRMIRSDHTMGSPDERRYFRMTNVSGKNYFYSPEAYALYTGVELPSEIARDWWAKRNKPTPASRPDGATMEQIAEEDPIDKFPSVMERSLWSDV